MGLPASLSTGFEEHQFLAVATADPTPQSPVFQPLPLFTGP